MTAAQRFRRVRPTLRRIAIAAFLVLVPIAIHTAWDHHEARRLAGIVSEIRAKNEPVSWIQRIDAQTESPENAARFYDAAAALIDSRDLYGVSGLLHRMSYAPDDNRAQLTRDIRSWLERNAEAETFLARATELPFEGYLPGTGYNYRTDRLLKLARLANLRTFERLEAGDADGAARALVQQLRIGRALGRSGEIDLSAIGLHWSANVPLRDMSRLIKARPPDSQLSRVQTVIREIEDDRALERAMLAERAYHLGSYWNESHRWYAPQRDGRNYVLWCVIRPMMTRRFVDVVEIMTVLIDRARQPWPDRLHVDLPDRPPGSEAVRGFPFVPTAHADQTLRTSYRSRAQSIAAALALGRTADASIAVEQYRRATGRLPESLAELVPTYLTAVPTDPFSGTPIRYATASDRVVVYSLGPNEKDDGGENVDFPVGWSGAFQNRGAPLDLGVWLQVRSEHRR